MNKNCAKCRVRGYICQGCEEAAAMNTNKIAVLAVMDTTDACLHSLNMDSDTKAMHIARFSEARAAVAELIEAASQTIDRLNTRKSEAFALRGGWKWASPEDRADFERMTAALARCKGETA